MKLKVIAAFNDMSIADPDTRRREIGDEFEAEDGRSAQLVALRLVDAVDAPAPVAAEPAPAPASAPVAEPVDAVPLHLSPEMIAPIETAQPVA